MKSLSHENIKTKIIKGINMLVIFTCTSVKTVPV